MSRWRSMALRFAELQDHSCTNGLNLLIIVAPHISLFRTSKLILKRTNPPTSLGHESITTNTGPPTRPHLARQAS
jgi:hypothetical protein